MIYGVYSVFDEAANAYLQPFFTPTRALAVRSFAELVNTADHVFAKWPLSFSLVYLGEFDDSTGVVSPLPVPSVIGKAHEWRKTSTPDVKET